MKNTPTIRKFSLTSLHDKLDLKNLEENHKTDFRITSANINRKSTSTTSVTARDSLRKTSRSTSNTASNLPSNAASNTVSKSNFNEFAFTENDQSSTNDPNPAAEQLISEHTSLINDYYYITLKKQENLALNDNPDLINDEAHNRFG